MLDRSIEDDVLPFCQKHNIAVLPYSSIAHGLLTGKFRRDWKFGSDDFRPKTKFFKGDAFKKNLAIVEDLKRVATEKGISMVQLAIAWVLAQPGITSAIVAAKTPRQAEENSEGVDVELSREELGRIDQILLESRRL
jgi:aryl-alcohol dehydrogenase-like predicted oxidoreductase